MRTEAQAMAGTATPLIDHVESLRLGGLNLAGDQRAELGQFLTPQGLGSFMGSMLRSDRSEMRVLDPGAGVGSLSAALVTLLATRERGPRRLTITAYEIDPGLIEHLKVTLKLCAELCDEAGISFDSQVIDADFVRSAVGDLEHPCVDPDGRPFNSAILNPPYRKLGSRSSTRELLRIIGVDASNLYAAFLAATVHVLDDDGDFVAITPRSFCNGPYFRDFRRFLLSAVRLRQLHLFDSRQAAFKSDEVLQENLIIAGERTRARDADVILTASAHPGAPVVERAVSLDRVVQPNDPERFIRFVEDNEADELSELMASLPATLTELGLTVSTGRVVDFRNRDALRAQPGRSTVPLIYPAHFERGFIAWPRPMIRKPNAIAATMSNKRLLVPDGDYVLVRRFSAKEERRRVVAACYERARTGSESVGFENHLNYFHAGGVGLDRPLARGLALFLNSTFVDRYVRQFSGHTQVNATDLRSLRYPDARQLRAAGQHVRRPGFPDQAAIDEINQMVLVTRPPT